MADYIVVHGIRICKNYENFVPETFGRLTTIGPRFMLPVGTQGQKASCQVCQCECWNVAVVYVNSLRRGHTKSCGCLQKELVAKRATTHGKSSSPVYKVWVQMKARCYNERHEEYENYGGRGITVCDRWLDPENGFQNFYSDMGLRDSKDLSIERDDVNGNYCPENCCWATPEEQARNRRTNVNLTYNGKTQCVTAWAEEYGMSPKTLWKRLRLGWSVEKALTTPVKSTKIKETK